MAKKMGKSGRRKIQPRDSKGKFIKQGEEKIEEREIVHKYKWIDYPFDPENPDRKGPL